MCIQYIAVLFSRFVFNLMLIMSRNIVFLSSNSTEQKKWNKQSCISTSKNVVSGTNTNYTWFPISPRWKILIDEGKICSRGHSKEMQFFKDYLDSASHIQHSTCRFQFAKLANSSDETVVVAMDFAIHNRWKKLIAEGETFKALYEDSVQKKFHKYLQHMKCSSSKQQHTI